MYGVGDKHRSIPYSGRGRPPKRALMGVPGEAGESSDEGEEGEDEGGAMASEGEYSEEQTDEEVHVQSGVMHLLSTTAASVHENKI